MLHLLAEQAGPSTVRLSVLDMVEVELDVVESPYRPPRPVMHIIAPTTVGVVEGRGSVLGDVLAMQSELHRTVT